MGHIKPSTASISVNDEAGPRTHNKQITSSQFHITAEQHESPQTAPTHSSSFGVAAAVHIDDFQPTAPGKSPGVGHRLEEGRAGTKVFIGSPDVKWTDDFRPTTPGESPGVGHPLVRHMENTAPNHPSEEHEVGHPLAGYVDDYQPTMPGRSSGVGESHGEEPTEQNK
ncbi:hypothetical protein Ancab_026014 [Ancistrocladus abbreviatus]